MTTTTAVVGVSTPAGRAVLRHLSDDDPRGSARRVLAVDARTPDMPPPGVEIRTMDPRDRLLPLALEGSDTVVHCAFTEDLAASPDTLYGTNVGGTRNVLQAASKAGVTHLVVLSSAMVYGAHPDNPLPLHEDDPLRANPGFAYAYQRQLVEELVMQWAADHPKAIVTILRVAPLMGFGVDNAAVRRLLGPRLVVPTGLGAPWQFVHVDDVGRAVVVAIEQQLDGIFNVAADGWLSTVEVANHIGRKVQQIGHSTLAEVLGRGTDLQLSPAPAEVLPYMLHPWVLATDRLRAHGWQARHGNREILTAFAREHVDEVAIGVLTFSRSRVRRVAAAVAVVGLAMWTLVRRD